MNKIFKLNMMNIRRIGMMIAVALMCSTVSFAQSSNVTNAKFSYDAALEKYTEQDFAGMAAELSEAIAEIEPATKHEKTALKEKTWRYRGMIYELAARNLDKPEVAAVVEDPVSRAAESYKKALELDKKGSYEVENTRGLNVIKSLAMTNGIDLFSKEDFAGAFNMFVKAEELATGIGVVDTTAIYNAALSADRGEDWDNAIAYYTKAQDLGYGATDADRVGLHLSLADIERKRDNMEAFEARVQTGLEAHPSDQGLLIEMVNIYLGRKEMDKAIVMLEKTLEQDPTNPNLQYSVGAVYDNLGEKDKARASYNKALELNADYFDANYNLGASYYNEAVEMLTAANEIPTNKVKEYNAAKAAAEGVLGTAIPFLEKAHQIEPTDQSTMASLAECYARTNQLEKRKEIMAKLGK